MAYKMIGTPEAAMWARRLRADPESANTQQFIEFAQRHRRISKGMLLTQQ